MPTSEEESQLVDVSVPPPAKVIDVTRATLPIVLTRGDLKYLLVQSMNGKLMLNRYSEQLS